jgi:predicted ATP-binding protein involved in virulence
VFISIYRFPLPDLLLTPLMKITKIDLHNFRGIRHLQLDFPVDSNVIVLVGANGVGKSSILHAMSSLLRIAWTKDTHGAVVKDGFQDSDIQLTQATMSCSVQLSNAQGNRTVKIDKLPGVPPTEDTISNPQSEIKVTNEFLVHYHSNKTVSSINFPFKSDDLYDFPSFFSWFKKIEDIENEERLERDGSYRDRKLETARKAVYSILGDDFSKLRVQRSINNLIINKQGVDIPVNLLSDGEETLITRVSDLARKLATHYPDMENPLEGIGIILIDEIELHMHPTWQRMIIPRLTQTFPNCQFIVTTHSPQVLSHIQPESIYLLKKVGEEIIATKPQYSYGRDSNRILEDLMDETERPAEIQNQLGELFSLIHQGHLPEAQQLVAQLSETIGNSEPELSKAEVMIRRQEILGR